MAIFNPILTSPIRGVGVDGSQDIRIEWDFQSDNNETQDSYQVIVYLVDDDSISHDSGVITSSAEFYDVPASTLPQGNIYFFTVQVVSGAITRTSRIPEKFKTLNPPTLTIDSIGVVGQFYDFTATYTQTQSVEVKTYQFNLYDNNDVLIPAGDLKFGQTLSQTFIGFANGVPLKVDVTVTNQDEVVITSPRVTFTPSYVIPVDAPEIIVTGEPTKSGNQIDWTDIVVLTGQVDGNFAYVPGKFNLGLELTNACLQWDLSSFQIPRNFTSVFWVKLDPTHDGRMWTLKKDNQTLYEVGLNRSKSKFYLQRDYRFALSIPVATIPTGFFLVGITPTTAYFFSEEVGASFNFSLQ